MYRVLPKDLKELKAIQGIGEAKLMKYGQRFLDVIGKHTLLMEGGVSHDE